MPSLLILQNADFEAPGFLPSWAAEEGFSVEVARAFAGELPTASFTHLVVLGTPYSVHDISRVAWLGQVERLARDAMSDGKSVLGICFGAQLLAQILGGPVDLGSRAEIGWYPLAEAPRPRSYEGAGSGSLFQWHRECFGLPPACEPFGVSAAGYLQGFAHGEKVLGLSGHLEITPALVEQYIGRCWSVEEHRDAVAAGLSAFRQDPAWMRKVAAEPSSFDLAREIFRRWLRA